MGIPLHKSKIAAPDELINDYQQPLPGRPPQEYQLAQTSGAWQAPPSPHPHRHHRLQKLARPRPWPSSG